MAEAEDIINDAARHATIFARDLWARHRGSKPSAQALALSSVAERLSLLISAVLGIQLPIRVAQPPPPVTFLMRVFRGEQLPRASCAIPATDGHAIWLPAQLDGIDHANALRRYRCMALSQAVRATRGSAAHLAAAISSGVEHLYLLLEARASEWQLATLLPGMKPDLESFRLEALANRPQSTDFPVPRRPLEALVREMIGGAPVREVMPIGTSPEHSLVCAVQLADRLADESANPRHDIRKAVLFKDRWTGELRLPQNISRSAAEPVASLDHDGSPPRSAWLSRRPQVREAAQDEDDEHQSVWMVQSATPQEHAEDPAGMQRPTDRDEETAAEEYADSVSELPEARLVSTPNRAKEILLSDDPPEPREKHSAKDTSGVRARYAYPEWDWRLQSYRDPGAMVHVLVSQQGPYAWVEETLRTHRTMCDAIRRQFEMLRANRTRLRKQVEGDELDLDAYVETRADLLAGRPMSQALYQCVRSLRRDIAITLLVDISGSTDAWVSANRRIVDVEREALLLVCIALEGMREPYSVLAFSGEGPRGVTVREIKGFEESYGTEIARRIAALEPERYTRAGAAIRHATAQLMRQTAKHRLLLLLSDGKPNDYDEYDGRYGAEDMRQAVTEARLQGIYPFCLTIDRHAADYLPKVFGANQYALLPKPELLPTVLLEWMKRLVE